MADDRSTRAQGVVEPTPRRERRYWRRRLARHAVLASASVACVACVVLLLTGRSRVFQFSMATAYVSLGLLVLTLILGPLNVLRGRANPVSTDLRRDIGIWAALTACAHVFFGLQVHLSGAMLQYFLWPPDSGHVIPFRYDLAGLANHSGLASTLILLFLLALSNDMALRRLGAKRWKSFQRWNYAGFALMAMHASIYQAMEQRTPPWILVLAGTVAGVVATQFVGWRRVRHS